VTSALRFGRFILGKRAPSVNWTERLMDTTTHMDESAKRKVPAPNGNRTPAVQPIASQSLAQD